MLETRDISSTILHLSFSVWWIQVCLIQLPPAVLWDNWYMTCLAHPIDSHTPHGLCIDAPCGKCVWEIPLNPMKTLAHKSLFYYPHAGWASAFRYLLYFSKARYPLSLKPIRYPMGFLMLHLFRLTNPLKHFSQSRLS